MRVIFFAITVLLTTTYWAIAAEVWTMAQIIKLDDKIIKNQYVGVNLLTVWLSVVEEIPMLKDEF